ncbi:tetratricopeptide repeat protein [Tuwongella immobilis]|uniref:Uncharacterized protein n=1 Tax=Tuwongella immobilis TaxID=692036 RepID=A0A6C2YPU8_9BACT|nr:tetratricopeptide repeat protein [Tuwongella immobilis]VIP03153.1 tetratricopeptide repeat protein : Tetratricopeptide repeat protein OS=Singulisphaera acidiphila (strain ATCC BAA-1392 / DSM 18658 / VKM B-2454 / MOB10) GN=Sinac_5500 PE=4 SV=1: TPR_8: TPR_11 [Tuwongella immobilis]VTS03546.1 tetratricopeptide repeat protein : Tetratricopeptide repeat protein OS=Singulisphaera acidiphila (strain ATCC BAA-1392 / DSM 18658 / VKM B-2454 / MOB10) GN=Sinac_5500 PE=4 SV=1: TPR_8: TPR_11 [Tuwongella imm
MSGTIIRCSMGAWLLAMTVGLSSVARAADSDESDRKRLLELNLAIDDNVMNAEVQTLLKDKPKLPKLFQLAKQMDRAKESPFSFHANVVLAFTADAVKDFEAAEYFYRKALTQSKLLKSTPKQALVYRALIDTLFDAKKYEATADLCQEFMDLPNELLARLKPAVLERQVRALTLSGSGEEALKLLDSLAEGETDGWFFLQLRSWVLRETGALREAADTYRLILQRIDRSELEEDRKQSAAEPIRYGLSAVYVDLNQIDKAAEQLQILLKQKPNDPTFNNDLGYIWADHDMNLDESERLVRKAIEEDRKQREQLKARAPGMELTENAAYLDSLGWVLFKKKNYAEAKKVLMRAVALPEGQNVEIMDHLAEVLLAMGDKAAAVETLEKSLKTDITTKRDQKKAEIIREKLKKLKSE